MKIILLILILFVFFHGGSAAAAPNDNAPKPVDPWNLVFWAMSLPLTDAGKQQFNDDIHTFMTFGMHIEQFLKYHLDALTHLAVNTIFSVFEDAMLRKRMDITDVVMLNATTPQLPLTTIRHICNGFCDIAEMPGHCTLTCMISAWNASGNAYDFDGMQGGVKRFLNEYNFKQGIEPPASPTPNYGPLTTAGEMFADIYNLLVRVAERFGFVPRPVEAAPPTETTPSAEESTVFDVVRNFFVDLWEKLKSYNTPMSTTAETTNPKDESNSDIVVDFTIKPNVIILESGAGKSVILESDSPPTPPEPTDILQQETEHDPERWKYGTGYTGSDKIVYSPPVGLAKAALPQRCPLSDDKCMWIRTCHTQKAPSEQDCECTCFPPDMHSIG